jgi:transposase
MAKYNDNFKAKIVQEYLNGILGYKLLVRKYGMPSSTPIKQWVQAYKVFGAESLLRKISMKTYSVQFKLDVLHFMKHSSTSYQETAIRFGMNNPSLIASWNSKFLQEGIAGLEKTKGRPSMPKKPKTPASKSNKIMSREEQLERENELLRLEVAYLKKLKAFRETPDAYLEKLKQHWPSNSKKTDLD